MVGMSRSARNFPYDTTARFSIELAENRIIMIRMSGLFDEVDSDRFFATLAPIDARVRAIDGYVYALCEVDVVQPPAIGMRMRAGILSIARPGDRIAMIYPSILAKLQLLRLTGDVPIFRGFPQVDLALTWLGRN